MFQKITKLLGGVLIGGYIGCTSQKNNLSFVEAFQYRANNPIEDRYTIGKLKGVRGVLTSVFDGHGGELTADFAAGTIVDFMNQRLKQNAKLQLPEEALIEKSLMETYDDLENSFLTIFKENIHDQRYRRVGSCALTAILVKDNLYVANVGDCEGVLLGQGSPVKINVRLNAGEPEEQARLKREFPHESDIYKCIKNTQYCYVKGRLQPTRSLGDFYLKYREYNFTKLHTFTGPYITHKPILTHYKLNDEQKYLVLATDGLWDELDEEEMNKVALHHQAGPLAKQLFNAALSKINIRNRTTFESLQKVQNRRDMHDDITVIAVDLEEWKRYA